MCPADEVINAVYTYKLNVLATLEMRFSCTCVLLSNASSSEMLLCKLKAKSLLQCFLFKDLMAQ